MPAAMYPGTDLASYPGRWSCGRLFYFGFLVLAFARTLLVERLRPRSWFAELRACRARFPQRAARSIWLHGEGLGEFAAAAALIDQLRQSCGSCRLVLSASRPTIRRWLAARYPDAVVVPPPWDLSGCVRRFFRRLRPRLLLLLEFHDGFCPGALLHARRQGIPVVVVNARRLPAQCPLRYRLAARLQLVRKSVRRIDLFCTQDELASAWFRRLGVDSQRLCLTGNLKFDRVTAPASGDPVAIGEPLLVAGSIHADEEALVIDAFVQLQRQNPRLGLILAPHDLGRIPALRAALQRQGIAGALRSERPFPAARILLLDMLGELAGIYRQADVAILGGSFTPRHAGHNLAEPAQHGRAIVFGPFMDSQRGMVELFLHHRAAVQTSAEGLCAALRQLLESAELRGTLGQRARTLVAKQGGATRKTLAALQPFLPAEVQP
jgi:3-deoxy-D-manno-octulosonic-acid transferase